MRKRPFVRPTLALAGLALLLTGCASTKPARLYVLFSPNDLSPVETETGTIRGVSVAIGPIRLPSELERPVLMTQSSESELTYSEYHRWASSLDRQVEQVVLANFASLLNMPAVFMYPNPNIYDPDYRIVVNVEQMTGRLGETASLQVRWLIVQDGRPAPLVSRSSTLSRDLPDDSHLAFATAQSLMLADLCKEIAQALKETPADDPIAAP